MTTACHTRLTAAGRASRPERGAVGHGKVAL